jgi:hypothetical protein
MRRAAPPENAARSRPVLIPCNANPRSQPRGAERHEHANGACVRAGVNAFN